MKKVLLSVLAFLAFSPSVYAGVPAFVTYSGRLTDGTGWGESTETTLVFNLYDSDDLQATPFWYTTHEDVPVIDGYFTVNLGMCPPDGGACTTNPAEATFPADLPDQMWVGVEVGGVELGREPVGSVPYAMQAQISARTKTTAGPCVIAANSVYRGNTLNATAVLDKGSFSETGTTKGHIRFPAPDGVTEVEGYRAAKLACEAAVGSPTAHFCTTQQLLMSVQVGIIPDNTTMWASNGTENIYVNSAGKAITSDCLRWRMSTSLNEDYSYIGGPVWRNDAYYSHTFCGNTLPIACCDFPE